MKKYGHLSANALVNLIIEDEKTKMDIGNLYKC
jgi:hypothetical protein